MHFREGVRANSPAMPANISLNGSIHAACPASARTRTSSTRSSLTQAWDRGPHGHTAAPPKVSRCGCNYRSGSASDRPDQWFCGHVRPCWPPIGCRCRGPPLGPRAIDQHVDDHIAAPDGESRMKT